MTKPCVFFDRDGIVNESPGPGYVERVEDFHLLKEFVEALKIVSDLGYPAILITNQRGVARGIVSQDTLDAIHHELEKQLAAKGVALADIYVCPHERDSCECRKPKPGMLLVAAKEHDLDLKNSWMVGDSESDVEAGRAAGCHTLRVSDKAEHSVAEVVLKSIEEMPDCLRGCLRPLPRID